MVSWCVVVIVDPEHGKLIWYWKCSVVEQLAIVPVSLCKINLKLFS